MRDRSTHRIHHVQHRVPWVATTVSDRSVQRDCYLVHAHQCFRVRTLEVPMESPCPEVSSMRIRHRHPSSLAVQSAHHEVALQAVASTAKVEVKVLGIATVSEILLVHLNDESMEASSREGHFHGDAFQDSVDRDDVDR